MSGILELLNTRDLTDVTLVPTRIKHGTTATFNIVSVKEVASKSDPTDRNIEIVVQTTSPLPSNKPGVNVEPGFKITSVIALKEVDKNGRSREESILQDCTRFRLCATGSKAGAFYPLEQYVGRQIIGNVSIEKDETGRYADQNRVAWTPPAGVKLD